MSLWDPQVLILGEVAVAMLLGGLVGLERELAGKPAGLRTHILVAAAAALLVGLGNAIIQKFGVANGSPGLRADPIRIIEAIITGISFLGAGTIFRSKQGEEVEGLTTAASILLCAAIGICVALGQWVLAFGVTLITLAVLRGLRFVERWAGSKEPR